jgi:hypothetical protein
MAAVPEDRAVWICPRTGDLVSDVGRLRAPAGNASPQALAACRAEVRDANTTVELR